MGFVKTDLSFISSDGRNITTLEPIVLTRPNGEVITAPPGFTSDGASTPKSIWWLIPPFGTYWLACVLHDFLYRVSGRPKDECDTILMEAMTSLGVELFLREAIYEGVHLGGQWAFDNDRNPKLMALLNNRRLTMTSEEFKACCALN